MYLWLAILVFSTAIVSSAQQKKRQPDKVVETPGLLYKITGKDLKKPSYLFGTIHIVCPNDMFSMEKLNGYLDQTDQLLMELDLDNAAEMMAMGQGMQMAGGKTLKDFLTAEQFAKVDEMFKNYMGFSAENVKQIKPFISSVMISTSPKALGCAPNSYELSFLKAAAEKKKPIEGLETVASQFAAFEKHPLEKQAKSLYEMALNPQKSIDQFKMLVETYNTQNAESLYILIDTQMKSEKDFQGVLLDDRNKDWIPKIEKAIGEKSSFIAVGGGHLGGKNGVVKLLRAKGYKVEAIKL
jgi:uncharacterized protein YbaP (TraB family)